MADVSEIGSELHQTDGHGDGDAAPDVIDFTCPRCRLEVHEAYYGPCSSCRTTLRVTQGGEAREVAEVAYEPKMNVTPNAVASKE